MEDASAAEEFFVEYLQKWRKAIGLKKFILAGTPSSCLVSTPSTLSHLRLVGHSMGGFISGCYALQFPKYIERLVGGFTSPGPPPKQRKTIINSSLDGIKIFIDPWGIAEGTQ